MLMFGLYGPTPPPGGPVQEDGHDRESRSLPGRYGPDDPGVARGVGCVAPRRPAVQDVRVRSLRVGAARSREGVVVPARRRRVVVEVRDDEAGGAAGAESSRAAARLCEARVQRGVLVVANAARAPRDRDAVRVRSRAACRLRDVVEVEGPTARAVGDTLR